MRWAVLVGSVTPRSLSSWNVVSTWKRTWTMRIARDQTPRCSGSMRRFCRGVKLKPVTILGQGQTYEYLQRRYTRVPEGMLIEPSLRYVEETLQDLDLDPTSKGVSTPGSAKDLLAKDVGEKMLDVTRAKTYASCVMRLVYLAQDRVDILHTVRLLSKAVSKPTEEVWARLKRLGRYLVGHPRSQTLLRASGHMDVLYAI